MQRDADPVQGFSPAGQLLHLLSGHWVVQAVRVAVELGIPELLGRRPTPVSELATRVRADELSLHRLMRALASAGIFAEAVPGAFVQTPMSALLRGGMPGNLGAFARFQGAEWHWQAWGGLLESVRTGRTAIELQHGAAHCFEYLAGDPAAARVFDEAMSGYAAHGHAAVVDVYDFGGARVIVDVGGGNGTLLALVLEHAPAALGVLFDQAGVAAGAPAVLVQHGVADRCRVVAGDFFDGVPAGGDLYLLAAVLHDWSDDDAIRILCNVACALPATGRVLAIEHVVPADDAPHPAKFIDLEMMLVTGGRERTASEYARLFAAAGLECLRVVPTAASVSIIEGRRPG